MVDDGRLALQKLGDVEHERDEDDRNDVELGRARTPPRQPLFAEREVGG